MICHFFLSSIFTLLIVCNIFLIFHSWHGLIWRSVIPMIPELRKWWNGFPERREISERMHSNVTSFPSVNQTCKGRAMNVRRTAWKEILVKEGRLTMKQCSGKGSRLGPADALPSWLITGDCFPLSFARRW
jgi:hypothetical protein